MSKPFLEILYIYGEAHKYLQNQAERNIAVLKKYFGGTDEVNFIIKPESEQGLLMDRINYIHEGKSKYFMFMDIDDTLIMQLNEVVENLKANNPDIYSLRVKGMDNNTLWDSWGHTSNDPQHILKNVIYDQNLADCNFIGSIFKRSLFKGITKGSDCLKGIHVAEDLFLLYEMCKSNYGEFSVYYDTKSYMWYNRFTSTSYKTTHEWATEGLQIGKDLMSQYAGYYEYFKNNRELRNNFIDYVLGDLGPKCSDNATLEQISEIFFNNIRKKISICEEQVKRLEVTNSKPDLKVYIVYGEQHAEFIKQCEKNLIYLKKYCTKAKDKGRWDYEFVQDEGGLLRTRINLINRDSSKYVLFLDIDDYFFGDFSDIFNSLDKYNFDILGCMTYCQNNRSLPYSSLGYTGLTTKEKDRLVETGNEGNFVGNIFKRDLLKGKLTIRGIYDLEEVFLYDDVFLMHVIWKLNKGETLRMDTLPTNYILGNPFTGMSLKNNPWDSELGVLSLIRQAYNLFKYSQEHNLDDIFLYKTLHMILSWKGPEDYQERILNLNPLFEKATLDKIFAA